MRLEIGNNQGEVIVDDTTGKIMSVMVRNVTEGKFDFHTFASYKNNHDGTHDATRWVCSNHHQLKTCELGQCIAEYYRQTCFLVSLLYEEPLLWAIRSFL